MENNTQEFNMDKYNELMNKIKSGSPVHKINFNLENQNAIIGMYLITMIDVKSYLDKIIDHSELNDNTLLVFESRHVIECCQIIYACLNMLNDIGMYKSSYEVFIDSIIDILLTKPIYYNKMVRELTSITDYYITVLDSNDSKRIFEEFKYIMKNIWFIPYIKIDDMVKEAINEFKEKTGV